MPQCSMPLQLSIHRNGLKKTLWVSKDIPLTSRNGQINCKYGLIIHLIESGDLVMCLNKSNASNSKCPARGVHHHLKWMIQWGVTREWFAGVTITIPIYWRVINSRTVIPLRSCSTEGSSRQTSVRLWPSMWINISRPSNGDCNKSLRK